MLNFTFILSVLFWAMGRYHLLRWEDWWGSAARWHKEWDLRSLMNPGMTKSLATFDKLDFQSPRVYRKSWLTEFHSIRGLFSELQMKPLELTSTSLSNHSQAVNKTHNQLAMQREWAWETQIACDQMTIWERLSWETLVGLMLMKICVSWLDGDILELHHWKEPWPPKLGNGSLHLRTHIAIAIPGKIWDLGDRNLGVSLVSAWLSILNSLWIWKRTNKWPGKVIPMSQFPLFEFIR